MAAAPEPPLIEIVKKERGRRFASVRRGLDPAQVDDYLTALASKIEAFETKLHEFRVNAELPPEGDTVPPPSSTKGGSEGYSERMTRFGEVGVSEVERMLADVKAEAATIVSEAKTEADRMTRDAEGEAGRSVDEARAFLKQVDEDAHRMLSDGGERRRQMTEELRTMKEHLLIVARDLDIVLDPAGRDRDQPESSRSVETGTGS